MRPERVSFSPEMTEKLKSQAIVVPSVTLRTPVLDVFVFASKIRLEGKHHVADFAVRVYMREDEDAGKKMLIAERVARLKLTETFKRADVSKWPGEFDYTPSLSAEVGLLLQNFLSYNDNIDYFERTSVYVKTNIPREDIAKTHYGKTPGAVYFQAFKTGESYRNQYGHKEYCYDYRFSCLKTDCMCVEKLTSEDKREIKSLQNLLKSNKSKQLLDASLKENRERFVMPVVIKKELIVHPFALHPLSLEKAESLFEQSVKMEADLAPQIKVHFCLGKQDFNKSTVDIGVRIYATLNEQKLLIDERIARLVTETPMLDYHITKTSWKKFRDPWDIANMYRLIDNIIIITKIITKDDETSTISYEYSFPRVFFATNLKTELKPDLILRSQHRKNDQLFSLSRFNNEKQEVEELSKATKEWEPTTTASEAESMQYFLKPIIIGVTKTIEKVPEPEPEPKPEVNAGDAVNFQDDNTTETVPDISKQDTVKTHVEAHSQNNDTGVADCFWDTNYY